MGACDGCDDREAEPRPLAGTGRIASAEALEGAWQKLLGEAIPLIGHVQLDPALDPTGCEPHVAAPVCKRVGDEVVERLTGSVRVGKRNRPGRSDVRQDPAPDGACTGARAAGRGIDQLGRVHRLAPDRETSLVGAGQHQQVVGEPREPLGLLTDRLERRP